MRVPSKIGHRPHRKDTTPRAVTNPWITKTHSTSIPITLHFSNPTLVISLTLPYLLFFLFFTVWLRFHNLEPSIPLLLTAAKYFCNYYLLNFGNFYPLLCNFFLTGFYFVIAHKILNERYWLNKVFLFL